MITYSNSPCRERDAHSLGRCSTAHHSRFRAFPRANRTQGTASTRGHSATSSTSEPPSFVPSLPWQCSVAGAWPGVDSGVASPRYNVRRPCAASTNKKRNNELPCLLMCPNPLSATTRVLAGNQSHVVADLFGATKTFGCPDDQHKG